MSNNKDHVLKRCRYLGISPTVIGIDKESNRKPAGNKHKKVSEYAIQLKEKQKLKFIYGVGEKQFRRYFTMAARKKGKTGEVLLQLLESRLDNVVYRLGFGNTRPQSRQLVTHANFEVNGKKVNIASYLVKPGDVITVREAKKNNPLIKENTSKRPVPEWLKYDEKTQTAKVVRLVEREEIDVPVEEHFIVELYNK